MDDKKGANRALLLVALVGVDVLVLIVASNIGSKELETRSYRSASNSPIAAIVKQRYDCSTECDCWIDHDPNPTPGSNDLESKFINEKWTSCVSRSGKLKDHVSTVCQESCSAAGFANGKAEDKLSCKKVGDC